VGNNAAKEQARGTQSGIDLSLMDRSVKPGDDFNKYANGTWEKTAVIPPDKSNISVFSIIDDAAEKRKAELVDGIVKSNPSSGDEAKIANYYKAYMDTAAIEKRGLAPIKPDIDRIGAIQDNGALAEAIGHTLRADTDPLNATNFHTENLLGVFVTQAFDEPTKTVPYILQGGLGLPDRDYYLNSSADMAKLRAAYTPYVTKILTLAGLPNAGARAQRIVALEHLMPRRTRRWRRAKTASPRTIRGPAPISIRKLRASTGAGCSAPPSSATSRTSSSGSRRR
jgi:putative endopeptidase